MSFALRKLIPPINLHVWGGLGTQLYALLLAHRLKKRRLGRSIKFFFHQSGVTQRFLQLPAEALLGFNHYLVQDFSKPQSERSTGASITLRLASLGRKVLSRTLIAIGVLARANTEASFRRIKPWVVSVRGHYTGLELTSEEILLLRNLLGLQFPSISSESISVHFRLGDLLNLHNKSYIDPLQIFSTLDGLNTLDPIDILSDSTFVEVNSIFGSLSNFYPIRSVKNLSIEDTMQFCYGSKVFIGTNSKISVWIAIFRSLESESLKTFLPTIFKEQLAATLPECALKNINFYKV